MTKAGLTILLARGAIGTNDVRHHQVKSEVQMVEIIGTYNTAVCYTNEIEPVAEAQIKTVCDRGEFAGCKIRIMPDVHAGKGCTIGTTMTITDKIVPGMVGVDIGCGMETVKIVEREIDFPSLDKLIRHDIPCGREIRKTEHALNAEIDLTALRCVSEVNLVRAKRSIGTLGGGNHFIEVARNDSGELYVVVHSGSRHIGTEVADWYQGEAYRSLCGSSKKQIADTIAALKAEGREQEISGTIKRLKEVNTDVIPKDLAYVSGALFDNYIHDMKIIQRFAVLNRQAMTEVILRGMGLTEVERFTTIHNYIDTDTMILRKGAVSAKRGERLLIPINMRDGSLICVGKGNDDWNQSAPHGAGRLMSRTAAFKTLSMAEYAAQMDGVFTTSVSRDTLDESPMAYKPIDEIISHIEPAADIVERVRPVYNFKASE
jgi:RNA-splicing ligase RtcB